MSTHPFDTVWYIRGDDSFRHISLYILSCVRGGGAWHTKDGYIKAERKCWMSMFSLSRRTCRQLYCSWTNCFWLWFAYQYFAFVDLIFFAGWHVMLFQRKFELIFQLTCIFQWSSKWSIILTSKHLAQFTTHSYMGICLPLYY